MSTNTSIRVILADDHKILRNILHECLECIPDIEVVGKAENGLAAVYLAEELLPDVIIMEAYMPVMNGIEATRIITIRFPWIKVIGYSLFQDRSTAGSLYEAGTSCLLAKGCDFEQIVSAIYRIVQGEELCLETRE